MNRHKSLHELVERASGLPFAAHARALLAAASVLPKAADDGVDLFVQWPDERPLVLVLPLGLVVPPEQVAAVARAVVELNARLPVPGFALEGQTQLVWATVVRRQPRGVPLQTLRAHVELAADMVALGGRHFAALAPRPPAARSQEVTSAPAPRGVPPAA